MKINPKANPNISKSFMLLLLNNIWSFLYLIKNSLFVAKIKERKKNIPPEKQFKFTISFVFFN